MYGMHEFSVIFLLKTISYFDGINWFAWMYADYGNSMYTWHFVRLFYRQRNIRYIDGFHWSKRRESH